ncbi:MAG: hypothetical protein IKZ97_02980, partial [Butyrivibrio sp.]|nr:hypothetical protein [Butyrivibrio sp.]
EIDLFQTLNTFFNLFWQLNHYVHHNKPSLFVSACLLPLEFDVFILTCQKTFTTISKKGCLSTSQKLKLSLTKGTLQFFLPAYSPEYNPDELLNSDIKRGVGAKFYAKTQQELEAHAYNHLGTLRNDPAKIRSFFDAPFTAYAG